MKSFKTRFLFLICTILFGVVFFAFSKININSVEYSDDVDSLQIDTKFKSDVSVYTRLLSSIDSCTERLEFIEKEKSFLTVSSDSLATENKKIVAIVNSEKNDSIKTTLKKKTAVYKKHIDSLNDIIIVDAKLLGKVENKISKQKQECENELKNIRSASIKLIGGHTIKFKGVSYNLFVTDLNIHEVQFHWNVSDKKHNNSSIEDVLNYLKLNGFSPLMVTNAGMYNVNYEPQGLYIDPVINNSKKYGYCNERFKIDTTKPNSDNFYMKPNGVFYIDYDNIPHIDTSEQFERIYECDNKIKYATQSGPMLVINGQIHHNFKEKSKNLKIRSGVGIIDQKHIVFAISNDETTFYDFAQLFRDLFNCKNALFLDGAISKMYLKEINPDEKGGFFGPMISISKKEKKK